MSIKNEKAKTKNKTNKQKSYVSNDWWVRMSKHREVPILFNTERSEGNKS